MRQNASPSNFRWLASLTPCSIASDSVSQGHLLQDEDSLLSHLDSYAALSDDKAELLRMLEEASCSSSSSSSDERDSEDEEEEISECRVDWSSCMMSLWPVNVERLFRYDSTVSIVHRLAVHNSVHDTCYSLCRCCRPVSR